MLHFWSKSQMEDIAKLGYEYSYATAPGIHTYHACECGRASARRDLCPHCIIDKMQEIMKKPRGKKKP